MRIRNYQFPALACLVALTVCGCDSRPNNTHPLKWVGPSAPPPMVQAPLPWQTPSPAFRRQSQDLKADWRLNPVSPMAARFQGLAAWQNGDYAQAIADENIAIGNAEAGRSAPQAQDYATRADSEAATKHLQAAWADFRQAIRLDPHQESTYIKFGTRLDQAHQSTQGVAVLTQATHALPGSAGCWGLLGWLQYQAGEFPTSLLSSARSEALDGSKSYVRYNQGLCYAALGEWPLSAATYRRALAHGTDEERQLALMEIRNALRKQPNSAALHQAEQLLMDSGTAIAMRQHD